MANELDKISQLPGNIRDQILLHMPIKDAMRTSILSRKWRYKWSSLPQLVFDDQCTYATLLHIGPLQKFKLSHPGFCATSDIDHWILYLSRISINEIVLDIWNLQNYKIPTSLFNCQDLIHLELNELQDSHRTFEGFKSLESLDLRCIDLPPDGLEALISRCPLLKRLGLNHLKRITRIKIKACNLESLDLSGAFPDIAFGLMKRLKSVSIGLSDDFNKLGLNIVYLSNLRKFFRRLPKIQNLKLEIDSLKYLAVGNVSQTRPYALDHLKYLFTCIDFNRKEEILTVMCLIKGLLS